MEDVASQSPLRIGRFAFRDLRFLGSLELNLELIP